MGIDNTANLIIGFTFKYNDITEEIILKNNESFYNEYTDKEEMKEDYISEILENDIEEKYKDIELIATSPYYDAPLIERDYNISFKINDEDLNLNNFQNLNFNFNEMIRFCNDYNIKYSQPKIFSILSVW